MWEPGFWNLTDPEAVSFRAWLNKGGFAVFEDFDGPAQWSVFEAQMQRVLPEGRLVRLDKTHPIFDTFFRIQDIDAIVHPMTGIAPSYYGIFEDNDPAQRLMVVANFDNDVPEYLGVVGRWTLPVRRVERGLQARGQLLHLRADAVGSRFARSAGPLSRFAAQACRAESRANSKSSALMQLTNPKLRYAPAFRRLPVDYASNRCALCLSSRPRDLVGRARERQVRTGGGARRSCGRFSRNRRARCAWLRSATPSIA